MKTFGSFCALCLIFLLPFLTVTANAELYDTFWDRFSCPDPNEFIEENPEFEFECVDASIPPWPVCLFHNVTTFIHASVSSASRCCDFDNLDECKCPLKYTDKFQNAMEEWCPKIATCPIPKDGIDATLMTMTWNKDAMREAYIVGYEDGMVDAAEDGYYAGNGDF